MKLSEIKLKNFRNYKTETSFKMNDLACIIGKNDIGKSTILESLSCFFNDEIDKNDLSVNSDSDIIEISCIFDDLPETLILDATVETSLEEESLLNANNKLEIKKCFKIGNTTSKSTFIVANHHSDDRLKMDIYQYTLYLK